MSDVMSRPAARTLLLNPQDNVAVALGNLDVGTDTLPAVALGAEAPTPSSCDGLIRRRG